MGSQIRDNPKLEVLDKLLANVPGIVSRSDVPQLAVGVAGTGAPIHFHKPAFNFLFKGRKLWCVHPPESAVWSNEHIVDYVKRFSQDPWQAGLNVLHQRPGDVLFIPNQWAHGVINLEEGIAVAQE